MKTMKKRLAVAVTVALLAIPLSTSLAMANTGNVDQITMVSYATTTDTTAAEVAVAAYEAAPITTLEEVATAEGLKAAANAAVAAVGDAEANAAFTLRVTNQTTAIAAAKTTLQATAAEVAVAAYEAAPITTLEEVATAEGLKAAANAAVTAVGDAEANAAFTLRVTNKTTAIVAAKTTLQVAAAETAVAAYEAAPITTLEEVATAEGLKAAADTAVAVVSDVNAKTAFALRVTKQATAIEAAKTALSAPVVDANGNTIAPANWFTDLIGKIQLILTFDPARKAELNERHALAKLAEARELTMDGKTEDAQICLNEYTDKIAKAQAFLDQVKDPTTEAARTLTIALANVNSNNVQVLSNLIDKLPPQAAQKLALNVVRSMEKAVTKLQKEEAKTALETTPATTSTTSSAITLAENGKILEKQAKVALENFKRSLNQKGKIHFEDQNQDNEDKNIDEQSNQDNSQQVTQNQSLQTQSFTQNQPTHTAVAPVKHQTAPTFRMSENNKDGWSKQADSKKNKGGDNRRGHK